ncbi:MAG TPA: hypothetical protein VLG12_07860 [Candidatus Saccharimonadales bacterium]|nr:hypothetical protein [Candidatus Saccharimonadales bacterium]
MITIIHGEDIAKSRKFFIEQRQQYTDTVSLNGQGLTLTEIMQVFEGNGLFSEEKYVFIEDFFSKKKASKEIDEIIKIINQHQADAHIYIWESKDVTPAQLKKFTTASNRQFKIPQTLFAFLDAVKPNNGKLLLQLFHQTLLDEDAQFLFVMLTRQFRLMLGVSDSGENPIEELKRMAPWQRGKLQKQAGLFTISQLKESYEKLFQIEYGMKTGNLTMSVEQSIDFFLLGL